MGQPEPHRQTRQIVIAMLAGMVPGVATVCIANVYGNDLSMPDYLLVVLTATQASVGPVGVPSVGLVTLIMVLGQAAFNDPEAGSVESATRYSIPLPPTPRPCSIR